MVERKARFRIHPDLIDRFGSGLYDTTSKALAELVANAHDAEATLVDITYPEEWGPEETIVVEDNGEGMSPKDVEDLYLWVGMNRRLVMPKGKGRKPIGEFGIGKFAGLGIAATMHVTTHKDGRSTEFVISKEMFEGRDFTEVEIHLHTSDSPKGAKGTRVVLRNLATDIVAVSSEVLIQDLSAELSRIPNFVVRVNGKEVPFGFAGGVREKIEIVSEVEGYGPIRGEIIIAKRPRDVVNPGLVVYANNRRMDGPTLFGYSIRSSHAKHLAYITGWVEADWLVPSEEQAKEGLRTPAVTGRMGLLRYRPSVVAFEKEMKEHILKARKKVGELLKEQAVGLLEEDKEIMTVLGHPETPVSPATRKFLSSMVEGLSDYRPATRVRIAKEVKRHIEVGERLYVIKAFDEAPPEDVDAFNRLLRDLSLREITNIAWEVRERYAALLQLQRLTRAGVETKEKILQRFLEDHPWILQEGYEKYYPNKQLKARLDKKAKRPDHRFVLQLEQHFVIVEIKKTGKTLVPKDAVQALEYRTTALKQYQNAIVETWLVGDELSEALEHMRQRDEFPNLRTFTYDEILDQAVRRHEYLLQHLPKEAKWVLDYAPSEGEVEMPQERGLDEEGEKET